MRQARAAAASEPMGLWEAPRRVVEVDGGMRAKGLAFWLADEHKIDMSKVELRQSPLEGLGVFAAQDLPAGEPLFDIPQSCCIYPELVFADRQLGKSMTALASKAGAGGIDTVALATYLAREKMMGAESRFRPFIEVCPWDSLHPLLWTEAEQDLLDFSYAYVQLNEILDQVDVATDIFEPVLNGGLCGRGKCRKCGCSCSPHLQVGCNERGMSNEINLSLSSELERMGQ